ncbi:hypothetical protein NP233_g12791 [Leucocoprinus birnbaumii]|uniref:Uncharacterized protein n=1 Tax=Leucocoprinus birnbaumii TaxID=56174 RepID=A0AAD5VDX5_9AGAR|nr:hypothetical protein NP233_g12791 [Leucocoprinus birnbaumii]
MSVYSISPSPPAIRTVPPSPIPQVIQPTTTTTTPVGATTQTTAAVPGPVTTQVVPSTTGATVPQTTTQTAAAPVQTRVTTPGVPVQPQATIAEPVQNIQTAGVQGAGVQGGVQTREIPMQTTTPMQVTQPMQTIPAQTTMQQGVPIAPTATVAGGGMPSQQMQTVQMPTAQTPAPYQYQYGNSAAPVPIQQSAYPVVSEGIGGSSVGMSRGMMVGGGGAQQYGSFPGGGMMGGLGAGQGYGYGGYGGGGTMGMGMGSSYPQVQQPQQPIVIQMPSTYSQGSDYGRSIRWLWWRRNDGRRTGRRRL